MILFQVKVKDQSYVLRILYRNCRCHCDYL